MLNVESCETYHGRLEYVNFGTIRRLMSFNLIPKSNIDQGSKCQFYGQANILKKSFQHINKNSNLLELIHGDICDSSRTPARARNRYFITFIGNFSRYCYTYLIRSKNEALNKFVIFKDEAKNQLVKNIKILRSDKSGEYNTNDMFQFCEENCIIDEFIAPYMLESNGVVEMKNRTFMDMVNAMLLSFGVPENLWVGGIALSLLYCWKDFF